VSNVTPATQNASLKSSGWVGNKEVDACEAKCYESYLQAFIIPKFFAGVIPRTSDKKE